MQRNVWQKQPKKINEKQKTKRCPKGVRLAYLAFNFDFVDCMINVVIELCFLINRNALVEIYHPLHYEIVGIRELTWSFHSTE